MTVASRIDLWRMVALGGRAVELGVAKGDFTAAGAAARPDVMIWAVDRWNDGTSHDHQEMVATWRRLRPYGNVCLVPHPFTHARTFMGKLKFDFIYVDGYAHTGQDGGLTLRDWYPLLKSGGIFAVHDYCSQWPANVEAVNSFMAQIGKGGQLTTKDEYPTLWWLK